MHPTTANGPWSLGEWLYLPDLSAACVPVCRQLNSQLFFFFRDRVKAHNTLTIRTSYFGKANSFSYLRSLLLFFPKNFFLTFVSTSLENHGHLVVVVRDTEWHRNNRWKQEMEKKEKAKVTATKKKTRQQKKTLVPKGNRASYKDLSPPSRPKNRRESDGSVSPSPL